MANGKKTSTINYRFLSAADFAPLHQTFLQAFSDYSLPMQITEEQFRNHITLTSVDLGRCVGAFCDDRWIGFTLNGFGLWNGRPTVYDAGTGVIPDFRKAGVGKAIFDFMTPHFRAAGYRQILLEVIADNEKAIGLYRKLGFETTRRLVFFERREPFAPPRADGYEIRELDAPDWARLATFADGATSWQNSIEAMQKTPRRVVYGAFAAGRCVGYGVFFVKTGIISQLAVAPEARRRGAAAALLAAIQERIGPDGRLRASNVDDRIETLAGFYRENGFREAFSQLEMIKPL